MVQPCRAPACFCSPDELHGHLRRMGESNAVKARRPLLRPATAARAAEVYAAKFGAEDGSLPATYQVPGTVSDALPIMPSSQ